MFQDEAGFGRINKPRYCWCQKGIRPSVPCHHIREYRYVYGAVEPLTGDGYFLVMPDCNTVCMNIFLKKWVSKKLSEQYSDDIILLCCDGAAWHKSGGLELPENIIRFHIPPYTPEMNPIEQIWKEIRKRGFRNEVFATLEKVVDRLCDTICSLSNNVISSITGRDWIIKVIFRQKAAVNEITIQIVWVASLDSEKTAVLHKNSTYKLCDLLPYKLYGTG